MFVFKNMLSNVRLAILSYIFKVSYLLRLLKLCTTHFVYSRLCAKDYLKFVNPTLTNIYWAPLLKVGTNGSEINLVFL